MFFQQLLATKRLKVKVSSSIECVYEEFKEKWNIEHALINKFAVPKEFKISIQCIKKHGYL